MAHKISNACKVEKSIQNYKAPLKEKKSAPFFTGESQKSVYQTPPKQKTSLKKIEKNITDNNDKNTDLNAIPVGISAVNEVQAPVLGTGYEWSMNPPPEYDGHSTSVLQVYKQSNSKKGLRLDYGLNVKTQKENIALREKGITPEVEDINWHWNQEGVSKPFHVNNHDVVGPKMEFVGETAGFLKSANKVLLPLAIASDAYNIYTAENKVKETARVAGGWAGSFAGAEAGAVVGAGIGSIVPGVGTAIGGFIGGLAGGIGGYFFGSKVGEATYDTIQIQEEAAHLGD